MPKEYRIKFGKHVRTRKRKYKRGKNEAKKALSEGKKIIWQDLFSVIYYKGEKIFIDLLRSRERKLKFQVT